MKSLFTFILCAFLSFSAFANDKNHAAAQDAAHEASIDEKAPVEKAKQLKPAPKNMDTTTGLLSMDEYALPQQGKHSMSHYCVIAEKNVWCSIKGVAPQQQVGSQCACMGPAGWLSGGVIY